jgi:dTDP-4-amino-4,6-dideoxygalactose transaminase
MTENFLPFAKPSISQAAIDEVTACLTSGWITTGPRVQAFEKALADYLGAPFTSALAHATAGLHLSLLTMGLQPGDEVITTSLTFVATLNVIVLCGAKPVLVDIDETYNMDVSQVEAAITPDTKVILPVHLTGLSVDLDPLYALAEKYDLRILEDAAQAIGTHYKGKPIGSFGDTQVFSFHPNKNMTTGEGGCVSSKDEAFIQQVNTLKFHGIDRNAWDRFGKKGSQHYDVISPGYKYNMMDIQAALGLHQLKALEDFIQRRTQLAKRYLEKLADWPEITLPQLPTTYAHRHSWHLFAIKINIDAAQMNRETFMQKMMEKGIGTGLHYEPPHLYRYYRETFGFQSGDFPKAEDTGSRITSLPLFPDMTIADQDRVIQAMTEILKDRR